MQIQPTQKAARLICGVMHKEQEMSYDGMRIYKYMSASQPVYEIRGNYIHKYMFASQPVYEIRNGRYIHEYMRASQPVYELR